MNLKFLNIALKSRFIKEDEAVVDINDPQALSNAIYKPVFDKLSSQGIAYITTDSNYYQTEDVKLFDAANADDTIDLSDKFHKVYVSNKGLLDFKSNEDGAVTSEDRRLYISNIKATLQAGIFTWYCTLSNLQNTSPVSKYTDVTSPANLHNAIATAVKATVNSNDNYTAGISGADVLSFINLAKSLKFVDYENQTDAGNLVEVIEDLDINSLSKRNNEYLIQLDNDYLFQTSKKHNVNVNQQFVIHALITQKVTIIEKKIKKDIIKEILNISFTPAFSQSGTAVLSISTIIDINLGGQTRKFLINYVNKFFNDHSINTFKISQDVVNKITGSPNDVVSVPDALITKPIFDISTIDDNFNNALPYLTKVDINTIIANNTQGDLYILQADPDDNIAVITNEYISQPEHLISKDQYDTLSDDLKSMYTDQVYTLKSSNDNSKLSEILGVNIPNDDNTLLTRSLELRKISNALNIPTIDLTDHIKDNDDFNNVIQFVNYISKHSVLNPKFVEELGMDNIKLLGSIISKTNNDINRIDDEANRDIIYNKITDNIINILDNPSTYLNNNDLQAYINNTIETSNIIKPNKLRQSNNRLVSNKIHNTSTFTPKAGESFAERFSDFS